MRLLRQDDFHIWLDSHSHVLSAMTSKLAEKLTDFNNGDVYELEFEFTPTEQVFGTCNKVFDGSCESQYQATLANVRLTKDEMKTRVGRLREAIDSGKLVKPTKFCSSLPESAPPWPPIDDGSEVSTYASSAFV